MTVLQEKKMKVGQAVSPVRNALAQRSVLAPWRYLSKTK